MSETQSTTPINPPVDSERERSESTAPVTPAGPTIEGIRQNLAELHDRVVTAERMRSVMESKYEAKAEEVSQLENEVSELRELRKQFEQFEIFRDSGSYPTPRLSDSTQERLETVLEEEEPLNDPSYQRAHISDVEADSRERSVNAPEVSELHKNAQQKDVDLSSTEHKGKQKSVMFASPDDSDPNPSSSGSDSDNDPNDKVTIRKRRQRDPPASREGTEPDWTKFKFKLSPTSFLKGASNWKSYYNNLTLSMRIVGYAKESRLSTQGELVVARAIYSTCTESPLGLIEGVEKGSEMIDIFRRTYATTGKIHREGTWEDLKRHEYDGKDPIEFTSKWMRLVRLCTDAGFAQTEENLIIMFLASVKEKAYSWHRSVQWIMRVEEYTLQRLIDEFNNEFRNRIVKKPLTQRDKNGCDKG
ncbi:hypothetical protein F4861DRAFT_542316 [Xylaria intraflava]|nr:hypothetical protein F4861DRAFT_542316 [Xylaria intraflava]